MKRLLSVTTAVAALSAVALSEPTEAADIIDTAAGAGNFNTLLAAVSAAGLAETLRGDGPFTVFAPTDDAFAALPDGLIYDLMQPENKDKLVAVLTYHVVPGKTMSGDLAGQELEVATVQGGMVDINATENKTEKFFLVISAAENELDTLKHLMISYNA